MDIMSGGFPTCYIIQHFVRCGVLRELDYWKGHIRIPVPVAVEKRIICIANKIIP